MIPGLQTHIGGLIPIERLEEVYALGYRMARIDAMVCSNELQVQMVADVESVGLQPFVTIADPARMRRPLDYECRNEDDGDLSPRLYRKILNDMAALALETGSRLWGPTCSNTNQKCVKWAKEVRGFGWPDGLYGISWHSYDPHENTAFADVEALAEGRPIIFSEFGYPQLDVTPEQQAEQIKKLWKWYEGYYGAIQFQIHDGPNAAEREHRYGIYACDAAGNIGGLKPCAFVVPKDLAVPTPIPLPPNEDDMITAAFTLSRKDAIPHPDWPGYYTSPLPGSTTEEVFSVNPPDGHVEPRPKGTTGPYESWRIGAGNNRAVFDKIGGGYTFTFPLEG